MLARVTMMTHQPRQVCCMGRMYWNMLSHASLVPTGLLVCPCLSPAWAEKEMYRNGLGFIGGWSIQPQNISPKPSIWQMLNSVTVATSLPWLGWGPTNYQDPSMCFAARIPHVPAPHRHHYRPNAWLVNYFSAANTFLACHRCGTSSIPKQDLHQI